MTWGRTYLKRSTDIINRTACPRTEHRSTQIFIQRKRKAALQGAYTFKALGPLPDNILILDDIYTSGTTMQVIINAIRKILPFSVIQLFTLACTSYETYSNAEISLKSYPFEWRHEKGWLIVEEDSESYALELIKLPQQILSDSFL